MAAEELKKVLASIEVIADITPHPHAERLHIITIRGYHCIGNLKSTFGEDANMATLIGTKVVFFKAGAVFNATQHSKLEFWSWLEAVDKKDPTCDKRHIVVRHMMKSMSEGIVQTLDAIQPFCPKALHDLPVGFDLTELLGITKYYATDDPEQPIKLKKGDPVYDTWPVFLTKTDQSRIQEDPSILTRFAGVPFTVTIKYDGQSTSWYRYHGEVGVCTRNNRVINLAAPDVKNLRLVDERYHILDQLRALPPEYEDIVFQGELCGPKIQNNPLYLKDVDLFIFDVRINGMFVTYHVMKQWCTRFKLRNVQAITIRETLSVTDVKTWVDYASQQVYTEVFGATYPAEGVVVKRDDDKEPYVSFKVISTSY